MSGLSLATAVGSVRFANPLMNASGCGGYGPELEPFSLHLLLGAVVSKGCRSIPPPGRPA